MKFQAYGLDDQPVGEPFGGELSIAKPPGFERTQAGENASLAAEAETHILRVHRSVTSIVPPCHVQSESGERFRVLGLLPVSGRLAPGQRRWRLRREQW